MQNIGIEPLQLLAQTINFLIMVLLLTKLLYKPIIKILEDRKKKIEESLLMVDRIKLDLERTDKKRQDIIDKARNEAKKIIETAKNTGKQLESEIVKKAHKDANSIIDKARSDLRSERVNLESELRNNTIEIASQMSHMVIGQFLTKKDHKEIIEKKLKDLTKLKKVV